MTLTDQDALSPERAANLAENPYAGQGSVLLDIGGDVGAVVLHLPAAYEGAEVAYRREGEEAPATHHATRTTTRTTMPTRIRTSRTSPSSAARRVTAWPTPRCSRSSSPVATSSPSPTRAS